MNWWKRLVEKWEKFIEDTAKANDQMWKGQKPSCCSKEEQSNEEEAHRTRKNTFWTHPQREPYL